MSWRIQIIAENKEATASKILKLFEEKRIPFYIYISILNQIDHMPNEAFFIETKGFINEDGNARSVIEINTSPLVKENQEIHQDIITDINETFK